MTVFDNLYITWLLKKIGHLHPKIQLPADKAQWDIGHRCLNYLARQIPLDKILLPSYYNLIFDQIGAGVRNDLTDRELKLIQKAKDVGMPFIGKQRESDTASIAKIQKYRAANCGELAEVVTEWLKKQKVNAQQIDLFFMQDGVMLSERHSFAMYTLPGASEEIFKDISQPHVRICDFWTGKCGQAVDVLNEHCKMLVVEKYGNPMPVHSGLDVILETATADNMEDKKYVVGKTVARFERLGEKPKISVIKNPECYEHCDSIDLVPSDVAKFWGMERHKFFPNSEFKKHFRWRRVPAPWELAVMYASGERRVHGRDS